MFRSNRGISTGSELMLYVMGAVFLIIIVRYYVGFVAAITAFGRASNNFIATLQGARVPNYPAMPKEGGGGWR